jgi:hypothetical protein
MTSKGAPDRAPFTHRYGTAAPARTRHWDGAPWRSRHHRTTHPDEPDPLYRCACPGPSGRRPCNIRATQEDHLCDACREHCWAVDDLHRHHRLIDLHQPSR